MSKLSPILDYDSFIFKAKDLIWVLKEDADLKEEEKVLVKVDHFSLDGPIGASNELTEELQEIKKTPNFLCDGTLENGWTFCVR